MSEDLKGLVSFLARSLVDDPDAISIDEVEQGNRITYQLKVPGAEKGKVIGRGGRTARAMRVLLNASAARRGVHAELEIMDT